MVAPAYPVSRLGFGSVTTASSKNKAIALRSKESRKLAEPDQAGRRRDGDGAGPRGRRSREGAAASEQGTTPLRNTLLYRKNACYGVGRLAVGPTRRSCSGPCGTPGNRGCGRRPTTLRGRKGGGSGAPYGSADKQRRTRTLTGDGPCFRSGQRGGA
jgi:hypothetical protein